MTDLQELSPIRECYYMIWWRNKKNGRKTYHRNTIRVPFVFRGYENALTVYNSLTRLHPETHLVKIYDDDPDNEVMVREIISYYDD